jgi:dynein heavy chain
VQSLQRILDCYLVDYTETDLKKIPVEELDNLAAVIDALFVFSLVWSVGVTTDYDGRRKFSRFLKDTARSKGFKFAWPD